MLPFIIIGVTAGSVYALGAVGLVLTYKTSGIFNFGYGAISTTAAYLFYYLHVDHGVNWPVAFVISTVVLGILLGIVFEPFARRLTREGLAMQVAATVGLLLIVQGFFIVKYGISTRDYPQYLPSGSFRLGGATVSVAQVVTVVLALVLTATLYIFFRRARLGIAMRGVVDDSDLLDVAGTPSRTVRRAAWMIGCVFASLSGVLLAPSLTLDPNVLSLLIVQTFGAAAIGGFTSLPLTYVGGLAIGVGASVLNKYVNSSSPLLAGIPSSLPFIVLFVVMLVGPRRWLSARQKVVPTASRWSAPLRVQVIGGVSVFAFFALVPQFSGFRITAWTAALCFAILFLSLGLLVRTAGQVSLCHLGFAAIGAAAFSHFASAGIPWLPALLLAGMVAMPVGALIAIPAIRLGGIYLALATLGFGVMLSNMFYTSGLMFGLTGASMPLPHLSWITLDSDTGFYYVVLAALVLSTIVVVAVTRTRLGRLLRGMADSPLALTTGGTSVAVTQVLVFAIAAYLAAIAGALFGMTNTIATSDQFSPVQSLVLVAVILIVPGGIPWYAILAAVGYFMVPVYVSGSNTPDYLQMFFGASAIAVALRGIPPTPDWLRAFVERFKSKRRAVPATAAARPAPVAAGSLAVSDLGVRFGGLRAVDGLSISVPTGRITGLIGPNGAGKTTTFNACCGIVRPTDGKITIDGDDVTRAPSSLRARRGVGRTFQQMQLFDSLTVAENVALGREAAMAGANPLTQVLHKPHDHQEIDSSTAAALDLCGIRDIAGVMAGSLSTGQRRLVELARCLAGPFRFLLLDEPSSGLDHLETARFGEILQRVVEEREVGILLVEHDMALVMDVCQHIHVLDFGKPIFDGTPAEVRSSSVVQAAYLGKPDSIPEELGQASA